MAKAKQKVQSKKSTRQAPSVGRAYIFSGYNNTIVSITDVEGNTVAWGSGGNSGFKGSRKSTPYAATIVGENTARKALAKGVKEVSAHIKGVGAGKSQCVKALRNAGLVINKIVDITPVMHNGCRPPKERRQ